MNNDILRFYMTVQLIHFLSNTKQKNIKQITNKKIATVKI